MATNPINWEEAWGDDAIEVKWGKHPTLKKTMKKDPEKIMVQRPILWSSKSGEHVVVEGPFPHGFIRSLDARSVHTAATRSVTSPDGEMFARTETTRSGRYAKTYKEYVQEVENEWGPVGY